MNYKETILEFLKRFPNIKPWEMIKLNRYFLEYARELAIKNGMDPIKDYRRTSQLINIYKTKGYDCFGHVRTILDVFDKLAQTQHRYDNYEEILKSMVTAEELEQIKCFIEILESK